MSTEENKARTRRVYEEVFNQGNLAVVDELFSPNHVYHDPGFPEPIRGPEGFKQYAMMYRNAFPDNTITIEDLIAEGDTVAVRHTYRGTHKGTLQGIPPTGKQVMVTAMVISRTVDGKFAETWFTGDILGLLQQLGVVPAMG